MKLGDSLYCGCATAGGSFLLVLHLVRCSIFPSVKLWMPWFCNVRKNFELFCNF